jgi:hypothetical protein
MAAFDTATLTLLREKTTTGAGTTENGISKTKTYQANGTTSSGAGSATITVQGSNDEGNTWDTIGTITLTLATTSSSDSFTSEDRYQKVRGNVTAISGTGAKVNLIVAF